MMITISILLLLDFTFSAGFDTNSRDDIAIQFEEDHSVSVIFCWDDTSIIDQIQISVESSADSNATVSVQYEEGNCGELYLVPTENYNGSFTVDLSVTGIIPASCSDPLYETEADCLDSGAQWMDDEDYFWSNHYYVTVIPVNDQPHFTENLPISFQVLEDKVWLFDFGPFALDVESNLIIFDIVNFSDTPGLEDINIEGSLVSINPQVNFAGIVEIGLLISDENFTPDIEPDTSFFPIEWINVNDPPVIISNPADFVYLTEQFTYQIMVTDPDDIEFIYALTMHPQGTTVSETGLIIWSPQVGDYSSGLVVITVADNDGASDVQDFWVSVIQTDCNGDENGLALIDDCGICCGGNTEVECSYWNSQYEFGGAYDCAGVCDGDAQIFEYCYYGNEDEYPPIILGPFEFCEAFVPEGYVECLEPDPCSSHIIDCFGICDGSAYEDCAGICDGEAYLNECGCVSANNDWNPQFCVGCTDPDVCNYDPEATIDDGSCEYPPAYFCLLDADGDFYWEEIVEICTGSCEEFGDGWYYSESSQFLGEEIYGCPDSTAINYNPDTTEWVDCVYEFSEYCDGIEDILVPCAFSGCPDGYECYIYPEGPCVSSDCICDPITGDIICTDDCGGGACYPEGILDCEGMVGGSAYFDECGVCDDDPTNDCIPGCTDIDAYNYNPDADFDNGSCQYLDYYNVTIQPTGVNQDIIFSGSYSQLEPGDEIGIFDLAGVPYLGSCFATPGEILVGAGIWMGEMLSIEAIGSLCLDFGPEMPGYFWGNQIIIRVFRESENRQFHTVLIDQSGLDNFNSGEPLMIYYMELIPFRDVAINEFFFRPNNSDIPDYVELYNFEVAEVDISGWAINGQIIESGLIPPDSYFLLADNSPFFDQDGNEYYSGNNLPNSSSVGVALPTSTSNIILTDSFGFIVDEVNYDFSQGWPTGTANRGYAAELIHPMYDNNDPAHWESALISYVSPYLWLDDGSQRDYGSPLHQNTVFSEQYPGCTDPNADNYDPDAYYNDGSCLFTDPCGCTDPDACNYSPDSTCDDADCYYDFCYGCPDESAINFDPNAIYNDGTCTYCIPGDITEDDEINVIDITVTVGCILDDLDTCICADINADGTVDVSDIVEMVGMILGE